MDGSLGLEIALIIIFILLSGFFSSLEIALTGLSELRVRKLISEKTRYSALLSFWFEHRDRILNTILLGNTIALVTASMLAWEVMDDFLPDIHIIPAVSLVIIAVLVIGGVVPRAVARNNTESFVGPGLSALRPFYYLFYPVTFVMNLIVALIVGVVGNKAVPITEEDITYILDVSEEQGVLEEGAQQMISGILEISDTSVKEVMVPRTDMVAVSTDISRDELLALFDKNEHSRIPVYEETMDRIVGILYIKDLIKLMRSEWTMADYMATMHEPVFVPETKRIDEMLGEFQHKRQQMAIVVDEYGGVAGIVTMEDLLEEIVGDIWDEYDDEDDEEIVAIADNVYRVDARMNVDDLCEHFGIERTEDMSDYDTVGGLVYDIAGAIPSVGDRFKWRGFEIVIEAMTDNRLEEVDFIRIPAAGVAEPEGK